MKVCTPEVLIDCPPLKKYSMIVWAITVAALSFRWRNIFPGPEAEEGSRFHGQIIVNAAYILYGRGVHPSPVLGVRAGGQTGVENETMTDYKR